MALKEILKWPLIVAAIVVILRVILERAGAPAAVSNMLSVAALTTVLAQPGQMVSFMGQYSYPTLSLLKG